MLGKVFAYTVSRIMQTRPGEPVHHVEAPLTLSFVLETEQKEALITRFDAVVLAMETFFRIHVANQLLVGLNEPTPPGNVSFRRLTCDADAASLGNDLIKRCGPTAVARQFRIKRLDVRFGVYERARCFPARPAVFEYSYLPPTNAFSENDNA